MKQPKRYLSVYGVTGYLDYPRAQNEEPLLPTGVKNPNNTISFEAWEKNENLPPIEVHAAMADQSIRENKADDDDEILMPIITKQ